MFDVIASPLVNLGCAAWLAKLIVQVVVFFVVAIGMTVNVMAVVFLERRVLALFTVRLGPNRVGPNGVLQLVADAIKLIYKEDVVPADTHKFIFTLAPILAFAPVLILYGLLPFGSGVSFVDTAAGLFLFLAISSLSVVGVMLAGWASNNKYSLLGAVRSIAQAISYEVPLVLSILSVIIIAGSMRLDDIVQVQAASGAGWNLWTMLALKNPLGLFVFFICMLGELNRTPFDLSEAESELVSGYNTEYSGMKFGMFFFAEYAAFFALSMVTVTLFFGGYLSPFGGYLAPHLAGWLKIGAGWIPFLTGLEQFGWVMAKSYAVVIVVLWIRATLPRVRIDQFMGFSWKFLLPLALINIVAASVIRLLLK